MENEQSLKMTQETMFEGLMEADVPSRTVLTSVLQDGLLKKSIFASNSFIYHFDDIRDAIDLVLRSVRSTVDCGDKHNSASGWISTGKPSPPAPPQLAATSSTGSPPLVFNLNHFPFSTTTANSLKMNELFNSEEVRFACSLACENLLNWQQDFRKASIRLPSASILITLRFLEDGQVPFERVDVLVETIKGLLTEFGGPLLACSDLKRCLKTGAIFKFFAEFYLVSDCKRFLETSDRLGGKVVSDEHVQISFEGAQLYDIDREALFFSSAVCTVDGAAENQEIHDGQQQIIQQRRKDSISSIEGRQIITQFVC